MENFVDNRTPRPLSLRVAPAALADAQKIGMKKAFQINGLPSGPAADAGGMVCSANARAAVELSARAAGRSDDG